MQINNGRLFLTNKECKLSLDTLSELLCKMYKSDNTSKPAVKYAFVNKIDADTFFPGEGKVSLKLGADLNVSIGVFGLNYQFPLLSKHIDEKEFVKVVAAMFHEDQHVYQTVELMHHHDEDGVIMALEHLSQQGNYDNFYMRNYWQNCMEIDAEYNAIFSMHDYLKNTFPGIDADYYALDYVNEKYKRTPYFIRPKNGTYFESLDEIDDLFQNAYEQAKHSYRFYKQRRLCDIEYDNKTNHGNERQDVVMGYWYEHGLYDYTLIFDNESDGVRQRLMVAATVLHIHPEYADCYDAFNAHAIKGRNTFGFWLPGERQMNGFDEPLDLNACLSGSARPIWQISEEAKQFWPALNVKCVISNDTNETVKEQSYWRIKQMQNLEKKFGNMLLKSKRPLPAVANVLEETEKRKDSGMEY